MDPAQMIRLDNVARIVRFITRGRKIEMDEHWDRRFEGMRYSEPVQTKLGNCAVIFDFGSDPNYLSYAWGCLLDALRHKQDFRSAKLDVYSWADTIELLINRQKEGMLRTADFFPSKYNGQISLNTLVMKSLELQRNKYELLFVITEFNMETEFKDEDAAAYYRLSRNLVWVIPSAKQEEFDVLKNKLMLRKFVFIEK